MNLLHIDSSISGDKSVSRVLSQAVVDQLTASNRGLMVRYRDVVATPLDHLSIEMANEADNDELIYLHRSRNEARRPKFCRSFLPQISLSSGLGFITSQSPANSRRG